MKINSAVLTIGQHKKYTAQTSRALLTPLAAETTPTAQTPKMSISFCPSIRYNTPCDNQEHLHESGDDRMLTYNNTKKFTYNDAQCVQNHKIERH